MELYYIFATLWGREQYTLFGILFIVYGILLSVTACISVALTYFQLSAEDYRWWWRSIFSAGLVFSCFCCDVYAPGIIILFSPAAVEFTDAVKRLPASAPIDSTDIQTRSQKKPGSSLLKHEYL